MRGLTERFHSLTAFRSLFAQFLTTYFLLLLIPLILAVAVNSAVLGRFQETVEETRLAQLRQTRDVVSQSINDLEWRVFQIAGNPRLNRLSTEYLSTGSEDYGLIRELVGYLHGYTLYSSNLKSTFYVYLQEPPIVLTPYAMYRHEDFTDRRTYLQMEGTTLADWHGSILGRYYRRGFFPARRVTIEDFTNKPMVPYVQSLPVGADVDTADIAGVIVYFIGEEEFSSLLRNITLPTGGWVYITDPEGRTLTGLHSNGSSVVRPVSIDPEVPEGLQRTTVDGQDVFVVHTSSTDGWRYVAVLPSRPILAPINRLQWISVVSLALSMLIAMAIASIVSYRRAQPLQRLLMSLREIAGIDVHEGTSIRAINSGVRSLIDQSRHLHGELRRQEVFHQNLLVSRLLEGSFRNPNEMSSFLAYLDITIDETCFTVIVMSLVGFETLDSVGMIDQMNHSKVVLKDLVSRNVSERTFMHDPSEETIALIAMSRRSDVASFTAQLATELQRIQRSFEQVYHDRLLIGVGTPRGEILGIASSYEEARLALSQNRRTEDGRITVYTEDLTDHRGYYFPMDLEVRITNAARAGDPEALDRAFAVFYEENFEKREVIGSQMRFLSHELFGTYQKLLQDLTADGYELPESTDQSKILQDAAFDDPELPAKLQSRFKRIAEHMENRKRSHNRELIARIREYIETHYADHGLGLFAVSSAFSITESYLSFFFKEQVGENFSSYVESVRLRAATELLRDKSLSIGDIATSVGYNSDKTFRRVFKKVKGVSPSDYRRDLSLRKLV